jgi:hypothetical protein
MSETMTALEIGEAWLSYVTETFMLEDGCIRPQVQQEYQRLESTDAITQERGLWRSHTDVLIDKITQCPAELRTDLLASIDPRSLAFVQDRIQCGTELLTAMAQKGLKLNVEQGAASLPDFFRQILLQNEAA